MNVLIVYAHPEPESFNAALRAAMVSAFHRRGHSVKVSDLYAMKFDPVFKPEDFRSRKDIQVFHPYIEALNACETRTFAPDIMDEMEKVTWADLIIFQFPVWFTSWPAIMKGWIDRVFQAGFSFTFTRMYGGGLLKGKKGMLVATTGSPEALYSGGGLHGDIHELFTPVTKSVLEANGLEVLPSFFVFNAAGQTIEEGKQAIDRLEQHLQEI